MGKKYSIEENGIATSYMLDLTPPEHLDDRHCHDMYEILFVLQGDGRYIVEGSYYDIKPGTLMVIRPFEYHCVEVDSCKPYERYVINFRDTSLADDALMLLNSFMSTGDDTSGKFYSLQTKSRLILSLFERFEDSQSLPKIEQGIFMKMLLSELIVLLSASDGETLVKDDVELGARVIKYLNEHIDRDITLDKLAKRFFVSKYYLCRAFKKHNGISVHGYVNQKRVMYAKQLIESGETASGAAYRVGFGDYSAFYRAYVKVLGKSPTAD